jgi:hypothetical protein
MAKRPKTHVPVNNVDENRKPWPGMWVQEEGERVYAAACDRCKDLGIIDLYWRDKGTGGKYRGVEPCDCEVGNWYAPGWSNLLDPQDLKRRQRNCEWLTKEQYWAGTVMEPPAPAPEVEEEDDEF